NINLGFFINPMAMANILRSVNSLRNLHNQKIYSRFPAPREFSRAMQPAYLAEPESEHSNKSSWWTIGERQDCGK
ncbi:MAG: hypothetical protein R6U98_27350, partial [Pirellulaceae bacterium]